MTQVLFLLITQSPEINSLEIDAVSEWCLEPRTATGKGFNFLLKLRVGTFCTYSARGLGAFLSFSNYQAGTYSGGLFALPYV